jgi:hypothetical protein
MELEMAGITLSDAEAQLAKYIAAETAVLNNQSYTIGGRALTRANLKDIQVGIERWDARVKRLSNSGIKVRGATPI